MPAGQGSDERTRGAGGRRHIAGRTTCARRPPRRPAPVQRRVRGPLTDAGGRGRTPPQPVEDERVGGPSGCPVGSHVDGRGHARDAGTRRCHRRARGRAASMSALSVSDEEPQGIPGTCRLEASEARTRLEASARTREAQATRGPEGPSTGTTGNRINAGARAADPRCGGPGCPSTRSVEGRGIRGLRRGRQKDFLSASPERATLVETRCGRHSPFGQAHGTSADPEGEGAERPKRMTKSVSHRLFPEVSLYEYQTFG